MLNLTTHDHGNGVDSMVMRHDNGRASLSTFVQGEHVETLIGTIDGDELVLDPGQNCYGRRVRLPKGGA